MLRTTSSVREPQIHFEPGAARPAHVSEAAIDEALAESFFASDPPAWNPGIARPIPRGTIRDQGRAVDPSSRVNAGVRRSSGVIDVSRPREAKQSVGDVLVSLGALVGIALLAPVVVLVVGTPVAAAVRGLLELILWVFAVRG
jgi:hypothetical protein